MRRRSAYLSLLVAWSALLAAPASGFIITPSDPDPWLSTASGPRTGNGAPAMLTWSIVPDGTSVTEDTGGSTTPSNLISFLNLNFGGNPAQPDLTQQPWFHLFDESFGRWEELGGVNYVYESHDNGVLLPSSNGALGVRGDIRLGGFNIDGASGTLAFTWLPPSGSDMVFDTGDAVFYTNVTNSHVNFRNTVMHELGHGFGLQHVSSTSNLLMEPIIDTSFDGPQLDEVRGVQFFFGDTNEKTNGGQGNGSRLLATSLGNIAGGATATVGTAANVPGQFISAAATDFVSISNAADTDYYSFTVSQPSLLGATLTPRGGVFTQASQGQTPTSFNANARNNLALTVFDTNGISIIAMASANPAGAVEALADAMLPAAGIYYARISGADDTIQLYELSLSVAAVLPGDFSFDNLVDAADYTVWRDGLGSTYTLADYDVWKSHFGQLAGGGSAGALPSHAPVPEPATVALVAWAGLGLFFPRRRERTGSWTVSSAIQSHYNRKYAQDQRVLRNHH